MANTATALLFRLSSFNGTIGAAVTNPLSLDLIQVVNQGGKVVHKVTSGGTSIPNPATSTNGALLGQYFGANFAAAFNNPSLLDIIQVIKEPAGLLNGAVSYYLDSTGASFNT